MKFLCQRIIPLCSILLTFCACITTGQAAERTVISAKDRVAPALVHVRPVKEVFRRGERQEVSVLGSGFIISPDGYVVTNEHVAGQSSYVHCVLSDKDEVEAEVVGIDAYTDIAVLKLLTDRTDLPYVRLGSSEKLVAGQTVMALGSPHGLSRSVSLGIVSVVNRNLDSLGGQTAPYNNWIQTDAAINPGNSGGPLVNLRGEVVGINTRKLSGADNVGFAIPIDIAREVISDLIEHGKVVRSDIGVQFQEMTRYTDDPEWQGVVISDVDPLSPAYESGIRPGDILKAVNGHATHARFSEELPDVRKLIADLPVGAPVTLTLERRGEPVTVEVVTLEKSKREGEEIELSSWGFTISELTPEVIRRAQLRTRHGVVATGVQVGSPGHIAGLRQGDIIVEIDEEPVAGLTDAEERYRALRTASNPLVLFTIKRGAVTMFILMKQSAAELPVATPAAMEEE